MDNFILLTTEGFSEIIDELNYLKTTRRREIAEKIKFALAFGDISENSEYDEAKNEQVIVEKRILKLEKTIKNAKIIEEHKQNETIDIGSKVKILDTEFDEIMEYYIVGSVEADPLKGKISNVSPLGNALIGKKVGDIIEVQSPHGENIVYEIIEI